MITLTLTTEEADALHDALSLAHMERTNQMVPANDSRLAVLTRMIERGEIEQGALAGPSVSIAPQDATLASAALAYAITMHTVGPGCATNPVDDENQQQAQHLQGTIDQTLDPSDFCACAVCDPEEPRTFTHRIS